MADACVFLMENYDGEQHVNIGTGEEVSIRQLAETVKAVVGFEGELVFNTSGSQLNIGENCTIKSSFLSNLVGLSQRTIIVSRTKEARISIGNNVGISGATIYARKGISIGDKAHN